MIDIKIVKRMIRIISGILTIVLVTVSVSTDVLALADDEGIIIDESNESVLNDSEEDIPDMGTIDNDAADADIADTGLIDDDIVDTCLTDDDMIDPVEINTASNTPAYEGECGAQGDNVRWSYDSETRILTITGTGGMADYERYGSLMFRPWEKFRKEVKKCVIENGVTRIGNYAIYGFNSMTEVTIPDSVTDIGEHAFCACTSLNELKLPKNLTTLGDSAFAICRGLLSVTIPGKLENIGSGVFGSCDALRSVTFENGIECVGRGMFNGCENLVGIKLPKSVDDIGRRAFGGCRLSYLIITNKNCEAEIHAFEDACIENVYYPGSEEKALENLGEIKGATMHYNKTATLYPVTWKAGDEVILKEELLKGDTIKSLGEPPRKDPSLFFSGWFKDTKCTQPFEKGQTISKNTVFYAGYRDARVYKVYFKCFDKDANEWKDALVQTVYEGMSADLLEYEKKEDKNIIGYYEDEDYEFTFDPGTIIDRDMNIYVKVTDLTIYRVKSEVSDEWTSKLEVSFGYTDKTGYDGRKHVVTEIGTKKVTASASVNPDIRVEEFGVYLDGRRLKGISVRSFSYKNNTYPSREDDYASADNYMNLFPVLGYDTKDLILKEALKDHKSLKKELSRMMKPSYNKKTDEWTFEPVRIKIERIQLSDSTKVYTTDDLKKDPGLKEKDGILVWSGKAPVVRTKVFNKGKPEEEKWVVKVEIKGLYYQRVFDLGNGKKAVKKFNLKPGGWTYKTRKFKKDDQVMIRSGFEPATANFDYICECLPCDDDPPVSLIVNGNNVNWGDWDFTDAYGYPTVRAKRGCFTGELPSFTKE